jgi:hypothetical protein
MPPENSSLPLFPTSFKRVSRPDGKPSACVVWVYHCRCSQFFYRLRYALGYLVCPHCGRESWFGVEVK